MVDDASDASDSARIEVRTFLIADVRGYTRFTQDHGDEAASRLAAQFASVVRSTVPEFAGELVELRGDEAMCVFASARKSLRASMELQRRLRTPASDAGAFPLGVGIGLDAGEAVPTEGGYRGAALNVAARLCSVARPGQVIASDTVVRLAGREAGFHFGERRTLRLKGLDHPVAAVDVLPDDALPPPPPAPATSRLRLTRHNRLLAFVAVFVLAAAIGLALETSGTTPRHVVLVRPNSLAVIDPSSGRVLRDVRVGLNPWTVVAAFNAVWVGNAGESTVTRIDTGTYQSRTVGLPGAPDSVAIDTQTDSVWAFNEESGRVYQINPDPTQLGWQKTYRFPACGGGQAAGVVSDGCAHAGIAAGFHRLWLSDGLGELYTMNPASGRVSRVPGTVPGHNVAVGNGRVYMSDGASIAAINPASAKPVAHQTLFSSAPGHSTLGIHATADYLWVVSPNTGYIYRCDPVVLTCGADKLLGPTLNDVTTAPNGTVWVTVEGRPGELLEINPLSLKVIRRIRLGLAPTAVTYANGKLWVTVQDPQTATNQL